MKYYLDVLKKYAVFHGRARRSEYWYFALFNLIFAVIAAVMDNLLGLTFKLDLGSGVQSAGYGYIYLMYGIAILIPSLAVLVRRLHDVGKSGWYVLITLIPLVGAIWMLVLLFTDSNIGNNKYGPNPKGIGNTDAIDEIGSYLAQ